MEEKKYKEVLSGNYMAQNMEALKLIIEHGRLNFLNENFCKEMKKKIKKGYYTKEYYTDIIDIAKSMAEMPLYDIYELLEDKIYVLKMTESKVNKSQQIEKNKNRNREVR